MESPAPNLTLPLDRLEEGVILPLREEFGLPIIVAIVEGEVYAVGEVCTHRRCSLARGDIEGRRICCPCHGAEFDISTGAVLEGPATESLETYAVTVQNDVVTIAAVRDDAHVRLISG